VELVITIGRHAWRVPADEGWSYVAGLSVGQECIAGIGTLQQVCVPLAA
jgi:2-keto-4-pentenoate hydratase/2-oxohepta-3-ene-1,7-dioic acid hydratase in catechol pathway